MQKERSEDAPASEAGWSIPVLKTVAQTGEGVPELLEAVDRHREWMTTSGELERRRRERARIRVRDVVERELRRTAWRSTSTDETLRDGLDRIQTGDDTPYSVAAAILAGILSQGEVR